MGCLAASTSASTAPGEEESARGTTRFSDDEMLLAHLLRTDQIQRSAGENNHAPASMCFFSMDRHHSMEGLKLVSVSI